MPECLIINPHLEKGDFPWKNLAGVGVAFKLAQGLLKGFLAEPLGNELLKLLDLVALGTIADIVPLVGENRILVKYGLEEMAQGKRIGLKALCENANLDIKMVTSVNVGYILAPRINACGRIGDASLGVELLLTTCENEAREIAEHLNAENQLRKNIENDIMQQAMEMLIELDLTKTGVIVLYGQDWHEGVIGIVASRLVERYCRPVIILSKQNNLYKGSGRSILGFHLYQALAACQELLESFGGHSQAAGLTLKEDNIQLFIAKINNLALEILTETDFVPTLNLDGEINLEQVNFELLDEIAKLEPFGCANPEPLLVYRQGKIKEYKEVGSKGGHLKIKLKAGDLLWDGIGFNMANYLELAASQDPIDVAFTLDKNIWNGRTKLQLILKDLKSYAQLDDPYVQKDTVHISPTRDRLVKFYILLKKMAKKENPFIFGEKQLAECINIGTIVNTMDLECIKIWVEVFSELDLLRCETQGENLSIYVCPSPEKVNLEDSSRYLQCLNTRNK